MPTILSEPTANPSDISSPGLDHGICDGHPDLAWCGTDVSDEPINDGFLEESNNPCVVCMELDRCLACGRSL